MGEREKASKESLTARIRPEGRERKQDTEREMEEKGLLGPDTHSERRDSGAQMCGQLRWWCCCYHAKVGRSVSIPTPYSHSLLESRGRSSAAQGGPCSSLCVSWEEEAGLGPSE